MERLILHSPSEAISLVLGRRIGQKLEASDVVALWGELGAGKTLMARGIARGLGIPPSIPITSPTFTFINEYDGRLHIYHLDLYRLSDPDELETLPWQEALFGAGVALIEWPERLGPSLPRERLDMHLLITGEESRTIILSAHGESMMARLKGWAMELMITAGEVGPA